MRKLTMMSRASIAMPSCVKTRKASGSLSLPTKATQPMRIVSDNQVGCVVPGYFRAKFVEKLKLQY